MLKMSLTEFLWRREHSRALWSSKPASKSSKSRLQWLDLHERCRWLEGRAVAAEVLFQLEEPQASNQSRPAMRTHGIKVLSKIQITDVSLIWQALFLASNIV